MDDKVKELQKEVAHLQKRVDDLLDLKADLTRGLQDEWRQKEEVLESLREFTPQEKRKLKFWDGKRWSNGEYIKEEDLFYCEDDGRKGEFAFRRDVKKWYYTK